MARNFSDVFRSDDRESRDERESEINSDTRADQDADASADAGNEGISFSNERSSTDEDGESSSESTNLDVGGTGLGGDLGIGSTVDNLLGGSSRSESSEQVDG